MAKHPVISYEKSRAIQFALTRWAPTCECGWVPGLQSREKGTAASEPASQAQDHTLETFIKLGERVLEAQKSWPL